MSPVPKAGPAPLPQQQQQLTVSTADVEEYSAPHGDPPQGYAPLNIYVPPTPAPPPAVAPSSLGGSNPAPGPAYGVPAQGAGVPSSAYGAPSSAYGVPSSAYGAPAFGGPGPAYGAPAPPRSAGHSPEKDGECLLESNLRRCPSNFCRLARNMLSISFPTCFP
jgi:hypothetical protein